MNWKNNPLLENELNKITSLIDFLFLTAKVNKKIKLIHHNCSLHNTNKVNEKALYEETHILIGFCNLY